MFWLLWVEAVESEAVLLPALQQQQQPCRCHRCSLRDEQSGSNGQLLLLFLSMSTFVSSPCCSHHFCFKHGRVNLHILQAASLPIYLSSCFPPSLLLSDRAVLSGSFRALGLSRVMDDYQPSAVFHYAPGRFTGSLTTRHENQSLFLILPSHPPSMPPSLLQSRFQNFYISSVTQKTSIIERCVQNNIEICVWTRGNNCSSRGLLWKCQRG